MDKGEHVQKILNWIITILVVLLLALLGYYLYDSMANQREIEIEITQDKKLFPPIDANFTFQTVSGVDFKIKASDKRIEIEGEDKKIVFLKIFGWECNYCRKEIPELIKLKKDLGDTFEVIAIEAQQHSREESLAYIKEYGINYNIIYGVEQMRFYSYLKAHYGWSGIIPLTIVLGKGGSILAFEVGAKSYTLSELMKASIKRER